MISAKNVIRAILVVIAARAAYAAISDPEFRQLTIGMVVFAAVLFVVVSMVDLDIRYKLPPITLERRRRGAILLWLSAAAGAIVLVALPLKDSGDFDITGILFIMMNAGPLLLRGVCLAGVVAGFAMWRGWA